MDCTKSVVQFGDVGIYIDMWPHHWVHVFSSDVSMCQKNHREKFLPSKLNKHLILL